MSIIIHGRKGCGKTRHYEALRKAYGMKYIIDGYDPRQKLPSDTIAFTNEKCKGSIPYEEAKSNL